MTSTNQEPDLEVQDLEKRCGTVTALRAVSFNVAAGSSLGITGGGGAGKTTLVMILAGFVKPSSGHARVLGVPPGTTRLRGVVGLFSQRAKLPCRETVSEFLRHLTALQGFDPNVELAEAIERLELGSVLNTPCERVSASDAKRIGLAAALIGKPRIVLLDEPTLGLRANDARLVREAVRELALRSTVIFASADPLDLEGCDEVVTLSKMPAEANGEVPVRKESRRAPAASAISGTAESEPAGLTTGGIPS